MAVQHTSLRHDIDGTQFDAVLVHDDLFDAEASFHGLLTAAPHLNRRDVTAKVMMLHGWDDHAFMAPWANDPERGILHSESAARRALASLENFLRNSFDRDPAEH